MHGVRADAIDDIIVSDDLSALRLVLSRGSEPFYVELPTANAVLALPLLVKALNAAHGSDPTVARVSAPVDNEANERGEVVLVIENSVGAMRYSLNTDMVLQLTALLDHFLRRQFSSRPPS